jgi:membrane associated rhomboid family serine protease
MNIIKRPFRYVNYNAVYWLIGINMLIFAVCQLFGQELRYYMTIYLSMIPAVVVQKKWIWTFISYMFMHGNITHIVFNMLGLFIFGASVEKQMGSREFLLYYLLTGALAGVFSFGVYYFSNPMVPLIGASGAIFAVELAYAVFFPDSIIYIWGIIPLRAPVMVLGFTALEIIFSVTGRRSGVAHFTHLAGFAMGWLYFMIRFGVNPWRRLTGR